MVNQYFMFSSICWSYPATTLFCSDVNTFVRWTTLQRVYHPTSMTSMTQAGLSLTLECKLYHYIQIASRIDALPIKALASPTGLGTTSLD